MSITKNRSCTLCNGNQFTRVYSRDDLLVVKCNECGLVFQPSQDSDNNSLMDYYTHRSTVECLEWKGDIRRIGDIAEIILDRYPSGKLLDVGCGSGEFIFEMSKRGMVCTGLEPNVLQAEYAKDQGLRVKNEVFRDGLFGNEQFDVITFLQVMEHMPDPIQAVRTAYSYLHPGGMLVIDVPSYNNPRLLIFRALGVKGIVKDDFIKPHLYYFTPSTLSAVVKEGGFNIDRIDVGRYNEKFGPNPVLKLIDMIANIFGIGGIVLYGRKSPS
jgi:2-polyprenyl-3-methyl-5-hydroxy-6-metoxy-1,4-benzoquinol methylase